MHRFHAQGACRGPKLTLQDDRYFVSGSMDGKIRLWHIPEKKVALWNEVDQVKFITAITVIRNKFVVVGTYDGRCFFYTADVSKVVCFFLFPV